MALVLRLDAATFHGASHAFSRFGPWASTFLVSYRHPSSIFSYATDWLDISVACRTWMKLTQRRRRWRPCLCHVRFLLAPARVVALADGNVRRDSRSCRTFLTTGRRLRWVSKSSVYRRIDLPQLPSHRGLCMVEPASGAVMGANTQNGSGVSLRTSIGARGVRVTYPVAA